MRRCREQDLAKALGIERVMVVSVFQVSCRRLVETVPEQGLAKAREIVRVINEKLPGGASSQASGTGAPGGAEQRLIVPRVQPSD